LKPISSERPNEDRTAGKNREHNRGERRRGKNLGTKGNAGNLKKEEKKTEYEPKKPMVRLRWWGPTLRERRRATTKGIVTTPGRSWEMGRKSPTGRTCPDVS